MICTVSVAIAATSDPIGGARRRAPGYDENPDASITSDVMPLFWTIDSKAQLFTAVAEGHVTLADAWNSSKR